MVEPLQDQPDKPQWTTMVEEKKDEGEGDPIKIFLSEVVERQRNAMMDKFAHIL